MPAPNTVDEFLELVRKSGVVEDKRLQGQLERLRAAAALPLKPMEFAHLLIREGLLTHFQAEQFLQGKWRRFTIGKYKVLERLGAGGMGSVYLCEHMLMKRRVAVKVLPAAKAEDSSSLERFYREARAVAALDHPNIVRAYDIDKDENLHFLVMEHVDGSNLQEIIKRTGPIDVLRAAHYVRQSALGLQHAHEAAGLVHRDIKPGNILVDRNGIVKVLDMGLARFFHDDTDDLTKKYDENVLGTADYLAPEQALDSHSVDIRADIYSLGATFYFCLTGKPPFAEGTVAQKLIWHQTRQPKPIRNVRPDVSEGIVAVIERMMAKDPAQRYGSPMDVADALAPFTQTPIPPPPESEMPQFSLAATRPTSGGEPTLTAARPATEANPTPRKTWQVAGGPSSHASAPGPAPTNTATAPLSPPPRENRSAPVPFQPPPPPRQAAAPQPVPPRPLTVQALPEPALVKAIEPEAPEDDQEFPFRDRGPYRRTERRQAEGGKPKTILWLALGGVVLVLIPLTGFLVYWALFSKPKQPRTGPVRPPIVVDGTLPGALARAIAKARSGDRIWLTGDINEVNLTIRAKDITIEASPDLPAGKKIVWKCPTPAPDQWSKLITVQSVGGFTLRGITLDGNNQTEALVCLYGRCPGARLEKLEFRNSKQFGLLIANCEGGPDNRIQFDNLTFVTAAPDQSAVRFAMPNVTDVKKIGHLAFKNLTFNGPGKKMTGSKDPKKEQEQKPYVDRNTIELPDDIKIE